MYAKRIIPCLDVKNGRVVKGVSFVDLVDAGDPVACAAAYDAQGADELVLLDITATHEGRGTMTEIVRRVAETVFIPSPLAAALPAWRILPGCCVPGRTKFLSIPRRCGIRS